MYHFCIWAFHSKKISLGLDKFITCASLQFFVTLTTFFRQNKIWGRFGTRPKIRVFSETREKFRTNLRLDLKFRFFFFFEAKFFLSRFGTGCKVWIFFWN